MRAHEAGVSKTEPSRVGTCRYWETMTKTVKPMRIQGSAGAGRRRRSHTPIWEPASAPTTRRAAPTQETSPCRAYVPEPTAAVTMMAASDVAEARR